MALLIQCSNPVAAPSRMFTASTCNPDCTERHAQGAHSMLLHSGLPGVKPALARGPSRIGARSGAAAPLGAPPDIIKELENQRARQAEQLQIEAQARQQLEDMLLRIERHYKVQHRAHPLPKFMLHRLCIAKAVHCLGCAAGLLWTACQRQHKIKIGFACPYVYLLLGAHPAVHGWIQAHSVEKTNVKLLLFAQAQSPQPQRDDHNTRSSCMLQHRMLRSSACIYLEIISACIDVEPHGCRQSRLPGRRQRSC